MQLVTDEIRTALLANGQQSADSDGGVDHAPVVKFFTPWGGATWLISEMDPSEPDILFGLCDLGIGSPELGNLLLSELESLKGPFGLTIERDLYFTPKAPLTKYADRANAEGRIVSDL